MSQPELSIVVTIYNMNREAPRTLHSLSRHYQLGVDACDYEVIVVDNGSDVPFGREAVERFGENFRYHYVEDASPSPASAMNIGAEMATGQWLCMMIDGARLLTPGVLSAAMSAIGTEAASMVETIGFHLGPDRRVPNARDGYDRAAEDRLLAEIGWPDDAYRLFDVSCLSGSSVAGWYGPMPESNCLFVDHAAFERLDGLDERFDPPGGGLVNLDFYDRVVADAGPRRYRLLGEANFHQMHGGAATGLTPAQLQRSLRRWRLQSRRVRGWRRGMRPNADFTLWGDCGPHAQRWLEISEGLWPRR